MKALKEINHRKNFVIRTIRDGKVKVFGHWFKPKEEYSGELDGQRWAFGIYYTGDIMMDTLYLWGTEDLHRALNDNKDEFSRLYNLQPNVTSDGIIHWTWWEVI